MAPPERFIRVILESPFAGDRETNASYLAAAMLDCLQRNEAPFASHGLYPQCLDDDVAEERDMGISAGFAWRPAAQKTVVYKDLGISYGMGCGIRHAEELGQPIEYRLLGGQWADDGFDEPPP